MSSQLKLSLGHSPLGAEQGSLYDNLTTTPGVGPAPGNDTPLPSFTLSEPLCQAILYDDIGESR
jgi:hypothetical protein